MTILYFLRTFIDFTYIRHFLFVQAFFRDRNHFSKIKTFYRVQKSFT